MAIGVEYDFVFNHSPKELKPFIRAYKEKKKMQDEQSWALGLYFKQALAVVVSGALSKNSHIEYPKQPFSFEERDINNDPEANEKLAVAEMEKYIAVLNDVHLRLTMVISG